MTRGKSSYGETILTTKYHGKFRNLCWSDGAGYSVEILWIEAIYGGHNEVTPLYLNGKEGVLGVEFRV